MQFSYAPAGLRPYNSLSKISMMMHTPTARTVSIIISSWRFIPAYPPLKSYKMNAKTRNAAKRAPKVLTWNLKFALNRATGQQWPCYGGPHFGRRRNKSLLYVPLSPDVRRKTISFQACFSATGTSSPDRQLANSCTKAVRPFAPRTARTAQIQRLISTKFTS